MKSAILLLLGLEGISMAFFWILELRLQLSLLCLSNAYPKIGRRYQFPSMSVNALVSTR